MLDGLKHQLQAIFLPRNTSKIFGESVPETFKSPKSTNLKYFGNSLDKISREINPSAISNTERFT